MGRQNHKHLVLKCNKGINQQADLADPDECADALNVWAPNGAVEQRPGYVGHSSLFAAGETTTAQSQVCHKLVSTTYTTATEGQTLDVSNLAVGSYWFLGFNEISDLTSSNDSDKLLGIRLKMDIKVLSGTFTVTNGSTAVSSGSSTAFTSQLVVGGSIITGTEYHVVAAIASDTALTLVSPYAGATASGIPGKAIKQNANASWAKTEYWDGTEWKYLRVTERQQVGNKVGKHLGNTESQFADFTFVSPGDWASSTINSQAAYYIRFTIQDAVLDGEVVIANDAGLNQHASVTSADIDPSRGLFVAQFKTKKRYFYIYNPGAGTQALLGSTLDFEDYSASGATRRVVEDSIASIAVVPQFDEAFVAYAGMVMQFTSSDDLSSTVGADLARVDESDFNVGPKAKYNKEFLVLLEEWPRARFITFYNGRLWCAGIEGEPFTVKWSAASPAHKVWSALSFQPLMEDDNSPITGLSALGESVVVFKSDSIWIMVATGENQATGIDHFTPIRVVAGVGCVSNSSIQQVRGGLIFLAEDGVYRFDGTPNIAKLSDRIEKTVQSINPSRRSVAVSANWRTHHCYLLSVAADGSRDNNKTLVYDYQNNAWWIWDVPAKLWVSDEDTYDNERLYFVNQHVQIFEMGVGNHDHGAAISSNVLTQRIGENLNTKITVRQTEVLSDNHTSSLSVAVRHNDDENNETTGALDLTNSGDATYGAAVDGTDKYVLDRRRPRRLSFRKQGDWFQVKVSHSTKNTPMTIAGIDIGYLSGGRR